MNFCVLTPWRYDQCMWHTFLFKEIFFLYSGLPFCPLLRHKESACKAGNLGSSPGSGRSLGEGNGYSLQYFCLRNSMDRGGSVVHGIAKSQTQLSDPHFSFLKICFCTVDLLRPILHLLVIHWGFKALQEGRQRGEETQTSCTGSPVPTRSVDVNCTQRKDKDVEKQVGHHVCMWAVTGEMWLQAKGHQGLPVVTRS